MDEKKWEATLNRTVVEKLNGTNHLLPNYANNYVKMNDPDCICIENWRKYNEAGRSKICLQKCCPAVSSYSYKFDKVVVTQNSPLHNLCAAPRFFYLKGSRLKMTIFDETQKMTSVDLFGLIGGYLGLFVGISLVTIFEFVEFGTNLCFNRHRKNMQVKEDTNK